MSDFDWHKAKQRTDLEMAHDEIAYLRQQLAQQPSDHIGEILETSRDIQTGKGAKKECIERTIISENTLEQTKDNALYKLREAEKAIYAWACLEEVGPQRFYAFNLYVIVRTALIEAKPEKDVGILQTKRSTLTNP